jgi:hypothetical protein
MAENMKQQAAAQLAIAIGHLNACLHLWSPSTGRSPAEERASEEVKSWHLLHELANRIEVFAEQEGPGA